MQRGRALAFAFARRAVASADASCAASASFRAFEAASSRPALRSVSTRAGAWTRVAASRWGAVAASRVGSFASAPRSSFPARAVSSSRVAGKDTCTVTFKDEKDGSVTTVEAPMGVSLLEVAHDNDVDLEGACEGSLACSTCHVIVEDPDMFDHIPEADDDENDMLDLAFGLTDTSRLGCQVMTSPDIDGIVVRIPNATRNFAVDGYVPKPH